MYKYLFHRTISSALDPTCGCYGNDYMIGLLWIIVMKMLGYLKAPAEDGQQTDDAFSKAKAKLKETGNAGDMTEDNHAHPVSLCPHPLQEQDCNSNCPLSIITTLNPETITTSHLSNVSSNDGEATTNDASDYQWFAEYGYNGTRDPFVTSATAIVLSNDVANRGGQRRRRRQPPSILAELHSPTNAGGDLTYEDMARNIDANLAEIDMEDFRSEDINSILALPAMYCGPSPPDFLLQSQHHGHQGGEQAASLSNSIMARFSAFQQSCSSLASGGHHSTSGESTDMSVCKSDEPLFSPVKESAGHLPTFSVDSLDCDSYDERELMLTCQANMNNYTIAFEGSFAKYSDDSDYHEAAGSSATTDSVDSWSPGQFKLRGSDSVDGSLVQSDFVYTTWSKLKRVSEVQQQSAIESGSPPRGGGGNDAAAAAACKSQSLPNLFRKSGLGGGGDLRLSQLNISMDSEHCVPVYDISASSFTHSSSHHSRIANSTSSTDGSLQSLSLMRLFMQQRTGSSSGTPSVSNSMSSGTLHQLSGGYRNDSMSSTDERLHGLTNVKYGSGGYCSCNVSSPDDGSSSKEDSENHVCRRRCRKSAESSPSRGPGKRAIKQNSGATCKLYGGEVFHEDASGRTVSPLASPIEEEEEKVEEDHEDDDENDNEEMLDWSSSFNKDTVIDARDLSSKHSDTPPDMEDSIDELSDDTMTRNNNAAAADQLPHDRSCGRVTTVVNNLKPSSKSTNEKSGGRSSRNNRAGSTRLAWADDSDPASSGGSGGGQVQSQSTQTKRLNNRSLEDLEPLKTTVALTSHSVQTSAPNTPKRNSGNNNNNNHNHHQGEYSSSSSGYTSGSANQQRQNRHASRVTVTRFKSCGTQIPVHVCDESVQTSLAGDWLERVLLDGGSSIRMADCVAQTDSVGAARGQNVKNESDKTAGKKSLYICYPNYSLPDLAFLTDAKNKDLTKMIHKLLPTKAPSTDPITRRNKNIRPHSCTGLESLRNVDFSHIQDWDSLDVLLPHGVRDMLHQLRAKSMMTAESDGAKGNAASGATEEELTKEIATKKVDVTTVDMELANMFVYKYDNSDLDGAVDQAGHLPGPTVPPPPPPLPKRSISLPQGDLQPSFVSSKPPLPKSILRRPHPALAVPASSATKRQPSHAGTKRYSMPDFAALQRRTTAEACDCASAICLDGCQNINLASILGYELHNSDSKTAPPPCGCDIVRDIGAPSNGYSCGAEDDVTVKVAVDGQEVASGVTRSPRKCSNCTSDNGSRQLPEDHQCVCDLCQCSCGLAAKNKKSVSFSSKLCDEAGGDIIHPLTTVKDAVKRIEVSQDKNLNSTDKNVKIDNSASKDWPSVISEDSEAECAPLGFDSSNKDTNRVNVVPSLDNDYKALDKWISLLGRVTEAVEILNSHFNQTKDPHLKFILGSGIQTPSMGHKILNHLCPALFAILDDGLQTEIFNTFGHLYNSVWMVVEATTQSGNCTKQMSELVVHINNDHCLREKKMKFNAFIFGLLNTRSLDTWFALLGTSHGILQKHYSPDAFLNVVRSKAKPIFDELLLALQSTSLLPFDIDLSLEIDLHKSHQQHQHHRTNCPQRKHQPIIHSWTTTKPAVPPKTDRAKQMAHRHSCGHLDNYDADRELGSAPPTDTTTIPRRTKPSHLQLRRGYSEDSACATGSSGYSTGGRTTAASTPEDDGERNLHRPDNFSGVWLPSPTRGSPEKLKRWSVGFAGTTDTNVGHLLAGVDLTKRYSGNVVATVKVSDEAPTILPSGDRLVLACTRAAGDMLEKNLKNEDFRTGSHRVEKDEPDDGAEKRDEEKAAAIEMLMATTKELIRATNLNRDGNNAHGDPNQLTEKVVGELAIEGDVIDLEDDDDEDGVKFKELRLRWEIISGASSTSGDDKSKRSQPSPTAKSRIPRLVTTAPPTSTKTKLDESSASSVGKSSSGSGTPVVVDTVIAPVIVANSESPSKLAVERKVESSVDTNNRTKGSSKVEGGASGGGNKNGAAAAAAKVGVAAKGCALLNQPSIVVKSSLDKSPIRKRVVQPRRTPAAAGANGNNAKSKQTMSRGVGGPDHLEG